jgi:pilus assembly protein CpaC
LVGVAILSFATPSAAAPPVVSVELNKGELIRLSAPAASVMVADPAIADIQVVSPRAVYVHAKAVGETSFLALNRADEPIYEATIEVTHNLSKLKRTMKELLPDADVQFKTVDGGLLIEGYTDSPQQSEAIHNIASGFLSNGQQVLNMVTTAGSDQVTLKVKVAEVSRNELKRFGINLSSILTEGNFAFQVIQGRTTGAVGALTRNGSDSTIGLNWTGRGDSVTSVMDALQEDGLVSILAEPTLTTTTGKTANFLAGGEVPIPTVDSDGAVNVAYRKFGISLDFTPTVLSDGKISLAVTPEVSSISSVNALQVSSAVNYAIPSLQVRRAQTTVELGSGQSFAIAGLFKNDRNNSIDRFPGLGDVPVLGSLFRSHEFQNDQTELVIIVTPYISHPVRNEAELATPLDGYYPPTDMQRLLLGSLNQEQPMNDEDTKQLGAIHGDGGFILE